VTYDAHEGWSGTVSFGADMGDGNLLIAGSVYNGAYAGFFNIINTASGQSAAPGAVLYDSEDNNIYISSIAVGTDQQIAAVGYIESYYERYEDTPALAGSGLNMLAVNTAVFGSNVPNTVDVGNGLWSITGGSIGSGSNSVTNLNTWQDLSAEYHVLPTQASGSISFAGASLGYAVVPANAAWALGTTWTIEWWSFATSSSSVGLYPVMCQAPGATGIDIYYDTGKISISDQLSSIAEPTPNTWTFVSVVCTAGTISIYYNGINQGATGLTAVNLSDSVDDLYLGTRGSGFYGQFFQGQITNIRITGGVALYSSNFTPPTAPLTNQGSQTLLLLDVLNSGSAFTDSSNNAFTVTPAAGATFNSSTPLTATNVDGSLYLSGGAYATIPGGGQWAMGTTWTIEFWSKALFSTISHADMTVLSQATVGVHDIDITYTGGSLRLGDVTVSVSEPPPGQWTFVSIQSNSGTITIYYNGVSQGNGGIEGYELTDASSPVYLGVSTSGGTPGINPFYGYITNLRISNTALYGGNFSAPTAPLANLGSNTLLLLDTVGSGTLLTDGSGYALTVTGSGTAWSADTPLTLAAEGAGAAFDASFTDGTGYSVSVNSAGSGYHDGDQLYIPGTMIANGASPANDLYITVSGIDGSGGVTSYTHSGTPNYDPNVLWLDTFASSTDYSTGGPWTVQQYQGDNAFIAQLNQGGTLNRTITGPGNNDDYLYSVAYDRTGNIYAAGSWYNGSESEDIVLKLDSNLDTVWSSTMFPNSHHSSVAVLPTPDASNVFVITNTDGGDPLVTKIDANTGAGIWTAQIDYYGSASINGGSEGGLLTPTGDVIVGGWAYGSWGSEGMVFSRISGSDGSMVWSNVLFTPGHDLGGWDWYTPNSFSLIDDQHFGAAGYETIVDGTEGAMVTKLPLDGSGQGTWGSYVYAPLSIATTVGPASLESRSVINEVGSLIDGAEGFTMANPRQNQFSLQTIGSVGGGNITNVGTVFFADGTSMSTAASGSGIGNLTVTGNVITVSPDTLVEFNTNVAVTGNIVGSNVISTGNTITDSAMVWTNGSTPKVWQRWNPITNSLDTYFS